MGGDQGVPWLGVLEGFYGPPYTPADRLDQLRWAASAGFDRYVYAPKNDPWQRDRWREPYPDEPAAHLRALVDEGRRVGVEVALVVSPGLDWRGGEDDHAALAAKARQLHGLGARALAVAWDDVPPGGADLGRRHAEAVARVAAALPEDVRWASCPTDYAVSSPTAYLRGFAERLPAGVEVLWTGPSVVSDVITAQDAAWLAALFGRAPVLADNVPVNDGPMAGGLHLGPYPLRDAALAGVVGGVVLNLGAAPRASRITAGAAARWWRDPSRDPERCWRESLAEVPGIEPLARAARSWLTEPGPDPDLLDAADALLDTGDRRLLDWLAAGCRKDLPADWAAELEDWLAAWEAEAFVIAFVADTLRGHEPAAFRALTVVEAWRRVRRTDRQLFGLRLAAYPLTEQRGDGIALRRAAVIEQDNLTDHVCRRALARLVETVGP